MKTLIICTNRRPFTTQPSCANRGSEALADWLEGEIRDRQLKARVERSVCLGHCPVGPNLRVLGAEFYHEASQASLEPLLASFETIDQ